MGKMHIKMIQNIVLSNSLYLSCIKAYNSHCLDNIYKTEWIDNIDHNSNKNIDNKDGHTINDKNGNNTKTNIENGIGHNLPNNAGTNNIDPLVPEQSGIINCPLCHNSNMIDNNVFEQKGTHH